LEGLVIPVASRDMSVELVGWSECRVRDEVKKSGDEGKLAR
jgi:hypothetical protein